MKRPNFSKEGPLGKIAGGAFAALLIKTTSAGLSFLMFVLLARVMTPEDYGLFASAFSLAIFLAITTTFGQPLLVLRFLSRYLGANDLQRAHAVIRFSRRRATLGVSMTALGCVFIPFLLSKFGLVEGIMLWAWVGLFVIAFGLAEYYSQLLRALENVSAALAPRDVFWRGCVVVFALAGIALERKFDAEPSLLFCAVSLLLIVTIQHLVYARIAKRTFPIVTEISPVCDDETIQEWQIATPGLAMLSFAGGAFQNIFVFLTALFLSSVEAGHFFAATKVAWLISLPLIATNMITAPMISDHYNKKEIRKLQSVCRMAIGLAVPLTLGGLLILFFWGHTILEWFGHGFRESYPSLMILSAGQLVNALSGPTGMLMTMSGHERKLLFFVVISNFSGLAVLAVLTPIFGISGAAIGTTLAQSGWNVAVWAWARQNLKIDPTAIGLINSPLRQSPRERKGNG